MQTPNTFDSVSFSLTSGQSDYDVAANIAGAFDNVKIYKNLEIRADGPVSIKINKTSNPELEIDNIDSPYIIPFKMDISNLYLSNDSGKTVNLKLFGTA